MKKLIIMLLAVAMLVSGVRPVSAMSSSALLDKIEKTYVINGAEFKISDKLKAVVERYIREVGVSETDADTIAGKIDEAVAIVKETGKTKIEDLPAAAKGKLLDLLNDVNDETAVKITYVDGVLTIYDGDEVFETVDDLVKQTGSETNSIAILAGVSFVVMLAGAFTVVRKVNAN